MTTKGFFDELQKIIYSQPKPETLVFYSENCKYADHVFDSKNLAYCFDTTASSDSTYLFDCHLAVECADCDYVVESESCYECLDDIRCFNCYYVNKANDVTDSYYSYDLSNCHNVFGCVNLTNKSYCIFNRQFAREEYEEKVKKYKALPPEKVLAMLAELKLKYPITQNAGRGNVNSPYGNNIYGTKNCYMCFDAGESEDCGYLYDSFHSKFCYDMTYSAKGNEISYQVIGSTHIYNSHFILNCESCQDSWYLINCKGVKNSIGCVGLQYKEYCILNRQFTKEEYERLAPEVIKMLAATDINWNSLSV